MDNQYTWNWSEDDEIWEHDLQDNIEKCIEDAKANYEVLPGTTIAVGEVIPYQVCVDIDRLLERIQEDAYQECGEVAEDWDIIENNSKAYEELESKVLDAVLEYLKVTDNEPSFYKIENIKIVEVK